MFSEIADSVSLFGASTSSARGGSQILNTLQSNPAHKKSLKKRQENNLNAQALADARLLDQATSDLKPYMSDQQRLKQENFELTRNLFQTKPDQKSLEKLYENPSKLNEFLNTVKTTEEKVDVNDYVEKQFQGTATQRSA